MASKAQKLKDKDSFSVFNDSQHEEELKAKEQSSIETQTTVSCSLAHLTSILNLVFVCIRVCTHIML